MFVESFFCTRHSSHAVKKMPFLSGWLVWSAQDTAGVRIADKCRCTASEIHKHTYYWWLNSQSPSHWLLLKYPVGPNTRLDESFSRIQLWNFAVLLNGQIMLTQFARPTIVSSKSEFKSANYLTLRWHSRPSTSPTSLKQEGSDQTAESEENVWPIGAIVSGSTAYRRSTLTSDSDHVLGKSFQTPTESESCCQELDSHKLSQPGGAKTKDVPQFSQWLSFICTDKNHTVCSRPERVYQLGHQ